MSNVDRTIPGYDILNPSDLFSTPGEKHWSSSDWAVEFERTKHRVSSFLIARDPHVIIAKTAMLHLMGAGERPSQQPIYIEQAEVEILQAIYLMLPDEPKCVPTSPRNFERLWSILKLHAYSFIKKQSNNAVGEKSTATSQFVRQQTVFYRNPFDREGCIEAMMDLLARIDSVSKLELGQSLSDTYNDLIRLTNIIQDRFHKFTHQVALMMTTENHDQIHESIEFFCSISPLAKRAWRYGRNRFKTASNLRNAGYQLSELANPWIFTISRQTVMANFSHESIQAIDSLSIDPNGLSNFNPEHIYMSNPVWGKPFISMTNGDLFCPLPHGIFSFPFIVFDNLIEKNKIIERSYINARSKFLEEASVKLLRQSLPSADVYKDVEWIDNIKEKQYENDIVVVMGNFIFLFEVKSGRISDAARRGAHKSLANNFNDLFVAPAEQALRLQSYLDTIGDQAQLWEKAERKIIDIDLTRPKLIYRFSICMEHFTSLTSAKSHLKEHGLIGDDTPWAPVLSLGELQMLSRFLDTEISFMHYLARRATIDEVIDFVGDEQDLLSMYLTNGFYLDTQALLDRTVMFHEADQPVRQKANPRKDRTEAKTHGVALSPLWLNIVRNIYLEKGFPHRFDIIHAILNQFPPAMAAFEQSMKRWKRGLGSSKRDLMCTKYQIGNRVHAVAVRLAKRMPSDSNWTSDAREIALQLSKGFGSSVDFAVFLVVRKSRLPFDGVSFFRFKRPS